LLTSPRFADLLAALRQEYDFVIVDTSALLAVTDPGAVAPRVDGVLLTFRPSRVARPQVERAREVLDTVGANLLGVVINAAGSGSEAGTYACGY
jgi:Mrp family chromosome partitioning ATPase